MESPAYLFDQYAAKCGLSANMAKRGLLMKSYADEGKTIRETASLIGVEVPSAQAVARKLLIDFRDYRPYAAKEKKGEPRPQPAQRDIALPASKLPLFA